MLRATGKSDFSAEELARFDPYLVGDAQVRRQSVPRLGLGNFGKAPFIDDDDLRIKDS